MTRIRFYTSDRYIDEMFLDDIIRAHHTHEEMAKKPYYQGCTFADDYRDVGNELRRIVTERSPQDLVTHD